MAHFHSNALIGAGGQGGAAGFQIDRSLRFNSGDSSYLSRSQGSGNSRTFTYSFWVKAPVSGTWPCIIGADSSSNERAHFRWNGDQLQCYFVSGGSQVLNLQPNRRFRDPAAWYHIVLAFDSTQNNSSDRAKLYVNGAQETSFAYSTYPSLNATVPINNSSSTAVIGRRNYDSSNYFSGYLAEVYFVDGQALAASNFGEYNDDNLWSPKEYAGGYDDWFDTSQTWSGLWSGSAGYGSFANLHDTNFTNYMQSLDATLTLSSSITVTSLRILLQHYGSSGTSLSINGTDFSSQLPSAPSGQVWVTITGVTSLTSIRVTSGDYQSNTLGLYAIEVNGKLLLDSGTSVANNSFNLNFSDNSSSAALGTDSSGNSNTFTVYNLTADVSGLATAGKGFQVITYTGNGSTTRAHTSVGFQPDFVWIKCRSTGYHHRLFDVVRGFTTSQVLSSNLQDVSGSEVDDGNGYVSAVSSSGFTTNGTNSGGSNVNQNSQTYVAWCWKAGGTASSNTDGTVTSQVSANTTYGFSIVTYTNPSSGSFTVGHGLGANVGMIITKHRNRSSDWYVWHKSFTSEDDYLNLNTNAGKATAQDFWGASVPGSSTFGGKIGTSALGGDTDVAYVWSEVPGFSKFGSWTGNGSSNGPTVTLGFKPRYILFKRTDASGDSWTIFDTERDSGALNIGLEANSSAAEQTYTNRKLVVNDTGFQVGSSGASSNASGGTYIYAAFADRPQSEGIDSLLDTPTNYEASSGNNGGNYATMNPLTRFAAALANGNLEVTGNRANDWSLTIATIGITSGKFYWEYTVDTVGSTQIGICQHPSNDKLGVDAKGYGYILGSGRIDHQNTDSAYGDSLSAGDVLGIAYDADGGNLYFYKNGAIQNSGTAAATGISSATWFPGISIYGNSGPGKGNFNFGQRPFAISSIPTGYKSLCTQNLADPTIADGLTAFEARTYTGVSGASSQTGYKFGPDFVWIKRRNTTNNHVLTDIVRGAGYILFSQTSQAEVDNTAYFTAFTSDGYSFGTDGGDTDAAGGSYVAWAWDAGSSNTSITAGSLNSSVYNQSQTWSSSTFFNDNGYNFYNSNGSATQLFDNVESGPGSNGDFPLPVNGGTFTLTFSQFSSATTVELEVEGTGNALKINGSFVTIPSGSPVTATYTVSGLTTIEWLYNGGSNYCYVGSIKVDGIKLVDSGVSVPNVPSIASTVRANPSTGFSIVTWTAAGNTTNRIGHGLNAAPEFIITKSRTASNNWRVWTAATGKDKYLGLNSSGSASSFSNFWSTSEPNSSTFGVWNATGAANNDGNMVAYCFAPVEGYSAFGSYTGNGNANGTFIYTGFKIAFLLIKESSGSDAWLIWDNARQDYNAQGPYLQPQATTTEGNAAYVDFLSNGFKWRTTNGAMNASGSTYIYAAFAEHPFKTARAR